MYGIEGAAIAWTARAATDALVLFAMAQRFLRVGPSVRTQTIPLVALAFVTLGLATLPQALSLKVIFLVLATLGFAILTWFLVLSPEERTLAREVL
jgi:hypothetical protein